MLVVDEAHHGFNPQISNILTVYLYKKHERDGVTQLMLLVATTKEPRLKTMSEV